VSENSSKLNNLSPLHGILALFVPGLGHFAARRIGRGLAVLIPMSVMAFLSIWTMAQRARFPEEYYADSTRVYFLLVLEAGALILFLIALRYLLARFVLKDGASQAFSIPGLAILYVIAIVILSNPLLETVANDELLRRIHGQTGLYSAAALAAYWFWQIFDAAHIGRGGAPRSFSPAILVALLLIFTLGWRITNINLGKAISEYRDTQVILGRIFWPWRNAFEFEQETDEAQARIQAPCLPGDTGPDTNPILDEGVWISVSPTCGDLSVRDLTGAFTLGTELTITGGGYEPGKIVDILWKNPIGNPFQPRSVGETRIQIDGNGEFETQLNIPDAIVPATAVGDQLHTLIVRQNSEEVFTGNMSREMNLALEAMVETIMLALMATFFGIVFAFPLSFLAARNLMSPISAPMHRVIGGLFLALPAVLVAMLATGSLAEAVGGLERAPIGIALLGLILVLGLGGFGFSLGGRLLGSFKENSSAGLVNGVLALLAAILAAVPGWLFGLGFVHGILSIPLGSEVVALETMPMPFPIPSFSEAGFAFSTNPLLSSAVAFMFSASLALAAAIWVLRSGNDTEIRVGNVIYIVSRTAMNVVRSIEPLIWAIVATIWVGLGPFAGSIALTLHTIAALGKLYSESIESIEPGPIEAINATGANRLQTIIYAVVPQILPPFISFTIYRWDINVRLSTIIGLVGGGGIGFLLIQWIRQFQYENAGIAVWLITITVASLDYVSSSIRERFV
jgi:phosphonate ABC transporter permease subunit PhnE